MDAFGAERYPEFVRQVMLCRPLCLKLKQIYFNDVSWDKCYRKVGEKLTELKKNARNYYPNKNETQIIMELNRLSSNAIHNIVEQGSNEPKTSSNEPSSKEYMNLVKELYS